MKPRNIEKERETCYYQGQECPYMGINRDQKHVLKLADGEYIELDYKPSRKSEHFNSLYDKLNNP